MNNDSKSDVKPCLSFVVPCMGRLRHLQETISTLINQPSSEYVLVDYSCPDNCGQWVKTSYSSARLVQINGESQFNLSKARNAGARAAVGEWLFFVDVDVLAAESLASEILRLQTEGVFLIFPGVTAGLSGALAVSRRDFFAINGYDEEFNGWGGEDDDIRLRLNSEGLKPVTLNRSLARHIPHGDNDRVRHYLIKDKNLSAERNRARIRGKSIRLRENARFQISPPPIQSALLQVPTLPVVRGVAGIDLSLVGTYIAVHRHWSSEIHFRADGSFVGGGARPNGLWTFDGEVLTINWSNWPPERLHKVGEDKFSGDFAMSKKR